GRFDDLLRSREVQLADAQIDDVLARLRKRSRARQNGKGIFLADAVEGVNRLEHASRPPWFFARQAGFVSLAADLSIKDPTMEDLNGWTACERPPGIRLECRYVRLEPLDAAIHGDGLFAASKPDDRDARFRWLYDEPPATRDDF